MSYISEYINKLNLNNRKAFTAFMTAGFPNKQKFVDNSIEILNAGADIFEIGIPFSDPLADGSVVQKTSHLALKNDTTILDCLEGAEKIKSRTGKPIILMGYSNPILQFGVNKFAEMSKDYGVDGIIIADLPLEEYNSFVNSTLSELDLILLTTPASTDERIKTIDTKSSGFVYCVSVNGTTGGQNVFDDHTVQNIERTYRLITRNKMLVGFGISSAEDIIKIKNNCDGVIVASSIMKKMFDDDYSMDEMLQYVSSLSEACYF